MPKVEWTAKLPTLLVGLFLWLLAAIVAGKRGWTWAVAAFFALGFGFIVYSTTIKEWCRMPVQGWGQTAWSHGSWSASFGSCVRKTWLEF
jgi:hypothetical protein